MQQLISKLKNSVHLPNSFDYIHLPIHWYLLTNRIWNNRLVQPLIDVGTVGQSSLFVGTYWCMRCVNENRLSAFPTMLVIVHITLTKYRITIPFQHILESVKKKIATESNDGTIHMQLNIFYVYDRSKSTHFKNSQQKQHAIDIIYPSCSCINSFNFATVFKISSLCAAYTDTRHNSTRK